MRAGVRISTALVAIALFATACGGGDSDAEAGGQGVLDDFVIQGDESLDPDAITTTTEPPAEGGGGASETDDSGDEGDQQFDETEDTIPDGEEETPEGEFFDSVGVFMSCLDSEGYGFIGIPNGGDVSEPVNDPGYTSALSTCAAQSQIVSKMEAAQDTSRFSAEEIEERNRGFVAFVDCLRGRGWIIPELTPDENGSLQPPYIDMARLWEGPDGSGLIDGEVNDDFANCGATPEQIRGDEEGENDE
ncbi:MAG: hypothetical protein R8F63_08140 [Acidimicrobiales bacterium]|nr:hypothetical protein [Acidimicrobiales bacterium]